MLAQAQGAGPMPQSREQGPEKLGENWGRWRVKLTQVPGGLALVGRERRSHDPQVWGSSPHPGTSARNRNRPSKTVISHRLRQGRSKPSNRTEPHGADPIRPPNATRDYVVVNTRVDPDLA